MIFMIVENVTESLSFPNDWETFKILLFWFPKRVRDKSCWDWIFFHRKFFVTRLDRNESRSRQIAPWSYTDDDEILSFAQ